MQSVVFWREDYVGRDALNSLKNVNMIFLLECTNEMIHFLFSTILIALYVNVEYLLRMYITYDIQRYSFTQLLSTYKNEYIYIYMRKGCFPIEIYSYLSIILQLKWFINKKEIKIDKIEFYYNPFLHMKYYSYHNQLLSGIEVMPLQNYFILNVNIFNLVIKFKYTSILYIRHLHEC